MNHETPPLRLGLGISICLIAYLFFITASCLVWSFQNQFPTIQILFIQNAVALFCLSPLALRRGLEALKTKELAIHLIRDVVGVLSYYLYFMAIRLLNLVDATTLNYTSPFFVPLIWRIWMHERIEKNVWWSIIVGFIGVAIILNPSRQILQIGFLLGLFAGISSAISACSVRVLNLRREPATRVLFYYFLTGTLLSGPFAWVYWISPTPTQWLYAIGIGISTSIAQFLLTLAYRHGTASYLSPLAYTSVIYAGLLSWILFGIPLTFRSLVGTLLIVLGGTLTYIFKKKPRNVTEAFQVPKPREKPPL